MRSSSSVTMAISELRVHLRRNHQRGCVDRAAKMHPVAFRRSDSQWVSGSADEARQPGGVAKSEAMVRHVARDHRAGPDHRKGPDVHARKHYHAASKRRAALDTPMTDRPVLVALQRAVRIDGAWILVVQQHRPR